MAGFITDGCAGRCADPQLADLFAPCGTARLSIVAHTRTAAGATPGLPFNHRHEGAANHG
jgi:hypothetical protein